MDINGIARAGCTELPRCTLQRMQVGVRCYTIYDRLVWLFRL